MYERYLKTFRTFVYSSQEWINFDNFTEESHCSPRGNWQLPPKVTHNFGALDFGALNLKIKIILNIASDISNESAEWDQHIYAMKLIKLTLIMQLLYFLPCFWESVEIS